MSHDNVYKKFLEMGCYNLGTVAAWFPNGYNSIRVRFEDRTEIIFTYYDKQNWIIQTIDDFMKKLLNPSRICR